MPCELTSAKLDTTGHRYLAELSPCDLKIQYEPGQTHEDAGQMSLLPGNCHSVPSIKQGRVLIQALYHPVDRYPLGITAPVQYGTTECRTYANT